MSDKLHKNHDRYFVPGLFRGLRVLEIIAEADRPLTISEIGKELGVSRSSAFRITYTLRHMGFLSSAWGDKAFELGPRILNLGFSYLNNQPIINMAKPFLENLRDETQISCHLAVREGREVLFLDTLPSKTSFVSNISTGTRTAAYSSPLGWILLSDLENDTISDLMNDIQFEAVTEHTPTNLDALLKRTQQVRNNGYIISRGFMQRGGTMIAAPIYDESGSIIAVIDISGPDSGFDLEKLEDFYMPKVITTARAISASLGHKS